MEHYVYLLAGPFHRQTKIYDGQLPYTIEMVEKHFEFDFLNVGEFCSPTDNLKIKFGNYKKVYFNQIPLTYKGKYVYVYEKAKLSEIKTLNKIVNTKKHERIKIQDRKA